MNPKYNKNIESYKPIKTLAKGSFGEVILVKSTAPDNRLYVMKIIPMDNMSEELKKNIQGSRNFKKIKSSKYKIS